MGRASYCARFHWGAAVCVVVVSLRGRTGRSGPTLLAWAGDLEGSFLPPGCKCVDSSTPQSTCTSFDCDCLCDLHAGSCDLNCCCDPECEAEEIDRFPICLHSGVAEETLRFCYAEQAALEKINARYPLSLDAAVQTGLAPMTCVVVDNSAVKGSFYGSAEQSAIESALTGLVDGEKKSSYHYQGNDQTHYTNGFYEVGDVIPIIRQVVDESHGNESTVDFLSGLVLRLPTADDGGFCSDHNAVQFGVGEGGRSCRRVIFDLSLQCKATLSVQQFANDIYVGVADDATLSEGNATHQQNFVQMKSNYNDTQNVTFWNAASNICANAIKSIEFQLTYNTFGKITKAVAEVETFDVALSDVLVEQHFSVQFLPENDTSIVTNSESNSTVTRVRSGNPGYLMEAPTLAAQLVSPNDDANFVNDMVEGITTFVPVGEGLCDVALPKRMEIGFGVESKAVCTYQWNKAELQDACTSTTNAVLSNVTYGSGLLYLPELLKTEADLVGIFGNADPLDRTQWLRIESQANIDNATNVRKWNASRYECEGIVTGSHFRFVWTYAGNVRNPQAKILGALIKYDQSTPLVYTAEYDQKDTFIFTKTVSWTYVKSSSTLLKRPPPTSFFALPEDVFYPFNMHGWSSGQPSWSKPRWNVLIMSLASAAMLFLK